MGSQQFPGPLFRPTPTQPTIVSRPPIDSKIIRKLYLTAETFYSCQKCGGICQIKDDQKTDGQMVLTRLKGQDGEEEITKQCPYCREQSTFKKIMREPI